MTRKLIAIAAALCLLAGVFAMGAPAASALEQNGKGRGEFQILCIPDANQMKQEDFNLNAYIEAAVNYTIKMEMPLDLVVFLGAVITGANANLTDYTKAAEKMLAPVVANNIPFVVVFGKGDNVGSEDRTAMMNVYKTIGGALCLNEVNGGEANFMVEIKKDILDEAEQPTGEVDRLANLFFFDVGEQQERGDPCISEAQVTWFKSKNDKTVPAFVFQHIPMLEVYTYMMKSPFNLKLGKLTCEVDGKNYLVKNPNYKEMVGTILENHTGAQVTAGEYAAFEEAGNVKAVFFGNNPTNNFVVNTACGTQLVQLPGACWNGADACFMNRGGAFIRIYKSGQLYHDTIYTHDNYTYRDAARLSATDGYTGHKVDGNIQDFWDFIRVIPYFFQNMLISLSVPFRWIKGEF